MKSVSLSIFLFLFLNISIGQTAQLDLKVFLEGPFFNNQMTPYLNNLGYLPGSQPYNVSPWNYQGTESAGAIPSSVVDWVLVDLLQASGEPDNLNFGLVSRKAGFLLSNGKITDLDGSSDLLLATNDVSGFHIRVHHRNHLPVTSDIAIAEAQGKYTYDFTTGAGQAIGGTFSQKLMSSGVWGMIAADGDLSSQIDNRDKNDIWIPQIGNSGYYNGDFNMDGQVDNGDLNGKWTLNAGQGYNVIKNPIIVSPENGRYFSVGGKAILLTGSHTWDNFQDIGATFNYVDYLNWMLGLHHNFIRLWAWESPHGTDWANDQNLDISPIPYKKSGSAYDLTQLNQSYFDRLQQRVQMANEKGIYVSIMLFEGFSAEHTPIAWGSNPFKAGNNINGIAAGQYDVHTNLDAGVLLAQRLYVQEVIDIVNYNKFNNVLYEIGNEVPYGVDRDVWQNEMIDFIHTYEFETYGLKRPVGKTFQYNSGSNETLFNSPADWISPNSEGGYDCREGDAPIATGDKVIISDTDHFYYVWYTDSGDPIDFVWKSFTGGINPIHMDNWGGGSNVPGRLLGVSNPNLFTLVRANMGYAGDLSERMDLISTTPQPILSSTGFCLASSHEYVVYFPENISVATVDLTLSSGQFAVEWLDAQTGAILTAGNITAGNAQTFTSPFGGFAVLYLKKLN
ncbi:MAG: hypothetical protein GXO89_09555 [Chlorobi bacterium]|nr:hypothetical protein [Chlorobiota bacterium]